GTFVGTFVNGSTTQPVALQSVSGDNTAVSDAQAAPFTLQPSTLRNLADDGGFPVSGNFTLGQFVNLTFDFDNGESATIAVPVVLDDGQWAGLDPSTPSASPTESPSSSESPSDTSS